MAKRCWLFKSEPHSYSLRDLERDKTTYWEGVRNYQARNMLRDKIKIGDSVLFYHSREKPMHVAGTAIVTKAGYPDPTQFDKRSKYHDEKSTKENPRWYVVDIEFESEFAHPVTLDEMRTMPALKDMVLLRKGSRLSIQPVASSEWKAVLRRGKP